MTYHAVLHSRGNQRQLHVRKRSVRREEREAEAFAYYLLVDSAAPCTRRLEENWTIATHYGIPANKMSFAAMGGFE